MPDGDPETGLTIQVRDDDFYIRTVPIGKASFEEFLHTLGEWRNVHEQPSQIGRAMCKPRPPKEV